MRDRGILSPEVTHRIGNWCEESVLREEQLKGFLEKLNAGTLLTQRHALKMQMALQPTGPLSKTFQFHQPCMIKNTGTNGYLSIDLPDTFPDNVTESDVFHVTTAEPVRDGHGKIVPTARSTMTLVPIDAYERIGLTDSTIRFGEKFHVQISGALVEKPMYLCSVHKNISQQSRKLKNQPAYLSFKKNAFAEWQIMHPDTSIALEMEGKPVPVNTPFYIYHPLTGAGLRSESGARTRI
ncbi:hypothetical protein HDU79_011839, partial [Rhizoclosmatium sp. JEL0117]